MNGEGGEGGGGAGGGDEDPSRLRVEKVGISALPKDITRRLPEEEGGDRRWQIGRRVGVGGSRGGGSTSARAAWLVAARWLRRALAAASQLSTDKGTYACVCQREFLSLFDFHNLFKRWRWKSIFPSPI